jgi:hypothetical protein
MEKRIRIREAVLLAKANGIQIKKSDLAQRMFPFTTKSSAYACFNNYERGASTKIDIAQVKQICQETGVDANFLFGIKPMK